MTKIQSVQSLFLAYSKSDIHAILAAMDDNIVWIEPGDPKAIPFSGTYSGKTEVLRMFGIEHQLLKIISFTPQTYFENDDSVVVLGNDSATVLATNKNYATNWTMVFAFNNNLIHKVQVYMDTLAIANAFKAEVAANY
jgi:ketosteroid isomerase-like protein